MKTLLMENGGIASKKTIQFVTEIDPSYVEYNTEIKDFMLQDLLFTFATLINPELQTIVTSSAFEMGMPYGSYHIFNKDGKGFDYEFKQIEYYTYLFFIALRYREARKMPCLTFHINYLYDDFLGDLKVSKLGEGTTTYLKLMLRQSEGYAILKIYDNYELKHILKTEDDLRLN